MYSPVHALTTYMLWMSLDNYIGISRVKESLYGCVVRSANAFCAQFDKANSMEFRHDSANMKLSNTENPFKTLIFCICSISPSLQSLQETLYFGHLFGYDHTVVDFWVTYAIELIQLLVYGRFHFCFFRLALWYYSRAIVQSLKFIINFDTRNWSFSPQKPDRLFDNRINSIIHKLCQVDGIGHFLDWRHANKFNTSFRNWPHDTLSRGPNAPRIALLSSP